MKCFLSLLFGLFLTLSANAQVNGCTCNDLFDKDLKTTYSTFNQQNSKQIILKYFKSDQTTRKKMQNDFSLEGSASAVIKKIPIDVGLNIGSSSSKDKYYSMYKETMENNYVSDEVLQSLYLTALPDKSFSSYDKCLTLCGDIFNSAGITLRNISTQDNLVVLEMRFKSSPAGGKITVQDAIYSTGTIVGEKKLEKDVKILDGQVLYEHIKIRNDEDITVSITFKEGGTNPASLSIQNKKKKKSSDAPLGTIVASLLNYNEFLKLNGLEFESDLNKIIWVPCDGRKIGDKEGTYGAFSGGTSPDLRGLFLRSVNDMGAYNATVPSPNSENLNPDNNKAGKTQKDAFAEHKHDSGARVRGDWTHAGNEYGTAKTGNGNVWEHHKNHKYQTPYTSPVGENETRPKNISVYYYIKIR